jgi:hypothetical protein
MSFVPLLQFFTEYTDLYHFKIIVTYFFGHNVPISDIKAQNVNFTILWYFTERCKIEDSMSLTN